eukprot:m.170907 g.170907  ORF g.170907 m.170907 type:complete len:105 (-) comp14538_c1_seq2:1089-1403(-)
MQTDKKPHYLVTKMPTEMTNHTRRYKTYKDGNAPALGITLHGKCAMWSEFNQSCCTECRIGHLPSMMIEMSQYVVDQLALADSAALKHLLPFLKCEGQVVSMPV